MNSALLAKLAWMVCSGVKSICMDLLYAKYKVSNDWFRAEPPKIALPTWREIERDKKLVEKGACYQFGDGRTINVWTDLWVPWLEGFKPQPRVNTFTQHPLKAFQLINQRSNSWNFSMISNLFSTESTKAILAIPILYNPRQGKLIWVPDSKGMFSVKFVHDLSFRPAISNNPQNSRWKKLWKARLPERLKMLLWRIGVDALPTKVNLNQKLNHIDPTCILCNSGEETCVHLFFECPFSRALWDSAC